MGRTYYCDLCKKPQRNAELLKTISIGEEAIAEACMICTAPFRDALVKAKNAPMQPAVAQPPPPPPEQETPGGEPNAETGPESVPDA